MAVLEVHALSTGLGGVAATDAMNITVEPGEIHAVIGPNGAGKTTLINQLTGELSSDSGRIIFAGMDITKASIHSRGRLGIARSYQITQVFRDLSVLENMLIAAEAGLV